MTARELLAALQALPEQYLDYQINVPEPPNASDFSTSTVETILVHAPEDNSDYGYVAILPQIGWKPRGSLVSTTVTFLPKS